MLETFWRECEAINFKIPYNITGNLTDFVSICTPNITVMGFSNFYDSVFTVFSMMFANISDLPNMQLIQYTISPILTTMFILFSSIIALNFFIGLMSNVLSGGAFAEVESHKSLEMLGYILQCEWRLSVERRQKHLEKIKNVCSPIILKHKEVILIDKDQQQTGPETSQTLPNEEAKLVDETVLKNILNEIREMKNETRELKKLLKINTNKK